MAVRAPLNFVESIDVDRASNLYIADDFGNVIRRVSKEGVITTVAGNWSASGFAGDGGPAVQATLDKLEGIAIANDGGFYFSDSLKTDPNAGTTGVIPERQLQAAMESSHVPGQAVAFAGPRPLAVWQPDR